MSDVERLLHYALTPVDPPRDMTARFERRLSELTDAALDEIAEFDPATARSPRRWVRAAAAGVVAGPPPARAGRALSPPPPPPPPPRGGRAAAAGGVGGRGGGPLVRGRPPQNHNRREARGLKALDRGRREVSDQVRRRLSR